MKTLILVCDASLLSKADKFDKYYNMLPDVFKAEVMKKATPQRKAERLCAYYLLSLAISELMPYFAEKLTPILRSELGKPYFEGKSSPFFSISHSFPYVSVIVSNAEVGLDIQLKKEIKRDPGKHFFSSKEHEIYINLDDTEREDYFFRLWSVKESIVKLTGKGLSTPLSEIDIDLPNIKGIPFNADACSVMEYSFSDDFCLSAASYYPIYAQTDLRKVSLI